MRDACIIKSIRVEKRYRNSTIRIREIVHFRHSIQNELFGLFKTSPKLTRTVLQNDFNKISSQRSHRHFTYDLIPGKSGILTEKMIPGGKKIMLRRKFL